MAAGALRLWREPRWGRWAVALLAGIQVALAAGNLAEAVLWRYRP
jgi:hypothetical protein